MGSINQKLCETLNLGVSHRERGYSAQPIFLVGMAVELENPVSNLEGLKFLCLPALGVMFSLKQPPVVVCWFKLLGLTLLLFKISSELPNTT